MCASAADSHVIPHHTTTSRGTAYEKRMHVKSNNRRLSRLHEVDGS